MPCLQFGIILKKTNIKKDNETDKKSDGKKVEKAKIAIFTEGGLDTIRNYSVALDTGMNRISWALNRNGVRFPSWNDRNNDDNDPSGSGGQVIAGRYKVVISFNDIKDSTYINVKKRPSQPCFYNRCSGKRSRK